jgi:hypothetical protein
VAEFHFLKGSFKGRLGDVVFSSWRGKDYAKTYTPPSNPNTPAQRDVRSTWGAIGHIAHGIYEAILKPYTYPKPQQYTAYNRMLVINKPMLANNVFSASTLKILDGPLTGAAIASAAWNATSHKITMTWSTTVAGSAKATDKAIIVAVQNEEAVAYAVTTRSVGTFDIDTAVFQRIKNGTVNLYLAFAQPPDPNTNEQGMNSITAHKQVVTSGIVIPAEGETPAPEEASAGGKA